MPSLLRCWEWKGELNQVPLSWTSEETDKKRLTINILDDDLEACDRNKAS